MMNNNTPPQPGITSNIGVSHSVQGSRQGFSSIGATTGSRAIQLGVSAPGMYNKLYANPLFDYLGEHLPREIKRLFMWVEHVYYNTPVIANAIKKYINYPITDLVYESEAENVRNDTKFLLENILNIKAHLVEVGTDYLVYGNVFRSVSFPKLKNIRCSNSGCTHNIHPLNASNAELKVRSGKISFHCPQCKAWVPAIIEEELVRDISKVRLMKWSPHNIDLKYNEVSGDTFYYYKVPSSILEGLKSGDKDIILSTPKLFLDAANQGRDVAFGSNFIHIKAPALSGTYAGWGISPLTHTLKMYLYMAILRKSNEAIALDQITPKNILFPQGVSGDPALTASLGDWRRNLTEGLTRWRTDPNYQLLAPFPTGVVNIGSQGKGLLVNEHILDAEQNMVRALDIPTELIYGTTNINNSGVTLRLLENQLATYTTQMVNYINWIIDLINAVYNTNYCHVSFTPFKLSDDVFKQQMFANLIGNAVSKSTFQSVFGLDPDEERSKLIEDAVNEQEMQIEIQKRINEKNQNIAAEAQEEAQAINQGDITQISAQQQQALIAKADNIAMEIANTPEQMRDQAWLQLKQSDYILYSLVKDRTEVLRQNMRSQGAAMLSQQNQQAAGQVPAN